MTSRRRGYNPQRQLSRNERAALELHLAGMPAARAEGFRRLSEHPGGCARLRDAGLTVRPRPGTVKAPTGTASLAGVQVDLDAIVAQLRATPRGRAALRARGIEP